MGGGGVGGGLSQCVHSLLYKIRGRGGETFIYLRTYQMNDPYCCFQIGVIDASLFSDLSS